MFYTSIVCETASFNNIYGNIYSRYTISRKADVQHIAIYLDIMMLIASLESF